MNTARHLLPALLRLCLVLPFAAQQSRAEDGKFDILWIASEPEGATVSINGEDKGAAPVFVGGLEAGRYEVSVSKPGYLTEQVTMRVPGSDGTQQLVTLRQRPGSCLITSEPSYASVLHGSQLLGRTPLVLDTLPPGTYELKLIKMGYEQGTVNAYIGEGRANTVNAKLESNTGSLEIACMPADAKILIDNYEMTVGKPASAGSNKSAPLRFDGLRPGRHSVAIEYRNVRSPVQPANVRTGEVESHFLMLWYPDTQIKTKSGETIAGMIIQQSPDGDLVVAKTLTDHVRVHAADILEKSEVPQIDARRMAKDALPK